MIAIDQPHKQNIAVVKGDRGAIGIFEDKYKAFYLSLPANTSLPPKWTSEGYSGYQVLNGRV